MRRHTATLALTGGAAGAVAVAATCAVLLAGCGSDAGSSWAGAGPRAAADAADAGRPAHLTVSGGYIPQPLLTDMAAAYFTVTSTNGGAARLTSVTTPLAEHVTLHTTVGTTMRQVSSFTVPAGGSLRLGTGGNHLMLENLARRPAVGDKVTLVLHFAHATPATLSVTVPVRPTTYTPKG
ncbi:copper chaperone PCu(A)C [Actinacidiphila sp. DG2A-62]|uniref:copper chaperone PCu(A)C n=1 Tax=Actinacidiphila sp. DG2A-62 TaxID=3108821 RepID=UPI002DBD078C|nr:copper chaperone PCu(A)C [Actinacidiphila sp. DG2A-62]MEC3995582.1 copper chaperone PCu(A)C [Actinacidiphila sp. DG2A-62]